MYVKLAEYFYRNVCEWVGARQIHVHKRAAMIILYKSIFSHTSRDSLRLRVETIIGAVEKLTYCLDIQLNQISHKSNR